MRSSSLLVALGTLLLGTPATAAVLPVNATLEVAIGEIEPFTFVGSAPAASSAGLGGAATLPADALSGVFQPGIAPPFGMAIDGIGVAAPGLPNLVDFVANASAATNDLLTFDGAEGTMPLNASLYLLVGGQTVDSIPLGVIGTGATQFFHVLSIIDDAIYGNPYQLGMVTMMGAIDGAPHTLVGTGVDNRTAGGRGTLVLVSPAIVSLGSVGTLATIATLTLTYTPEPGTLLLLGAGVTALAAAARRRRA